MDEEQSNGQNINDEPENDVEIINKTIPEVIVNETSFDESNNANSGDCATKMMGEPLAIGTTTTPAETTRQRSSNFDEEQLSDLMVVDDDDDSSRSIKLEPTTSSTENKEMKPKLNVPPQQPEKNVKEENANLSVKQNKDDVFLVHCAIRQSLSSETFVLQLDNADVLDSYLDKPSGEALDAKDLENEAKENNSNLLNVPASKSTESEKVCDALILTADDELETELSLEEKHGKVKGLQADNNKLETILEENSATSQDDNKAVIQKSEPTELLTMEVANDDENKKPPPEEDTKIDVKKSCDGKTRNVPRILWVSNVTQSVRASDLKQYITKIGKVVTAKIVTDGKRCYGYVVMDNPEDASKCLKTLNNAYFEGRKISLSCTRPLRSINYEKKSDLEIKIAKKETSVGGNDTDDNKIRESKERVSRKVSKTDGMRKRRRSGSRSLSSRMGKRQSSNDPLTTKFDGKKRTRSRSRHTSRDRKYLREKEERERLKRNLLEEQRRNRDEMLKQIQREERHREMEFKLEQERRKLQLERELFEKERREITRLDVERRKIEKERLEVLKQRSQLQEELEKSRMMKRKPDNIKFSMSSVIGKPPDSNDSYEKRKETLKREDDYNRKASGGAKHSVKINRDDRKICSDSNKGSSTTLSGHRTAPKTDRMDFKSIKDGCSKTMKSYEKSAPPPPKLSNDFDRKTTAKHSERKHEYSSEGKPVYCDRKSERGPRKIEVIERKYYPGRSGEVSERKPERIYRKPDFESRKPPSHMFTTERKYDYSRGDTKRYAEENNYPERDTAQRIQWPAASINYNNDPWKTAASGPISGSSSAARYQQEPNFPASSYGGGGPSRITPFYYHHPAPAPQDYPPRYDHCSQPNGRKY